MQRIATALMAGIMVAAVLTAEPAPEKPERIAAPAVADSEITGIWRVEGQPRVLVTIDRQGDGYFCQWNRPLKLPDVGIGQRRGSVLTVAFQTINSTSVGLARYELAEGRLVGTWIGLDAKGGSETLERAK